MYPNERTEQKRVVVDGFGDRREVVSESTSHRGPREVGLSGGTVDLIVLLAVIAILTTVYVVNNRNTNEAANREALREAAGQANKGQAPAVIQQPAQQPPVIIQQPAPVQPPPVIIQQPTQAGTSSVLDDTTIQDAATKRLTDDPDLASVSVTVNDARATLTGTASSGEIKAKAERVVKGVRGVKSIDNKIVVSGQ